jgi:hypothetical protein
VCPWSYTLSPYTHSDVYVATNVGELVWWGQMRLAASLWLRRPGFDPGQVHVVVDKLTMRQVFLGIFWCSLVSDIPPMPPTHSLSYYKQ